MKAILLFFILLLPSAAMPKNLIKDQHVSIPNFTRYISGAEIGYFAWLPICMLSSTFFDVMKYKRELTPPESWAALAGCFLPFFGRNVLQRFGAGRPEFKNENWKKVQGEWTTGPQGDIIQKPDQWIFKLKRVRR
jgi:hypothetical protein